MLFKSGTPLYAYEVQREAGQDIVYVNFLGANFVPSIAESPEVFSLSIEYLIKAPNATRIVFVQQRNYSYGFNQVDFLQEIARLYNELINQEKILSPNKLGLSVSSRIPDRYNFISYLLGLLKSDPVACYVELKRRIF